MSTPAISPRRTRPGNATAHPGQPVLDIMQKRRTRSQKIADERMTQDTVDAKEAAAQRGFQRIAELEMAMEEAQKNLQALKAKPVRPKPRPKGKKTADVGRAEDEMEIDDELPDKLVGDAEKGGSQQLDVNATSAGEHAGMAMKKPKWSLMKAGVSNARKNITAKALTDINADVNASKARADGKVNSVTNKKFAKGGAVKDWRSKVHDAAHLDVDATLGGSTSTPTHPPPSTLFSQVSTVTQATTSNSRTLDVPEDALAGGFADSEDDSKERAAALNAKKGKPIKAKLRIIEPAEDDGVDMELEAPLTPLIPKLHIRVPSTGLKRKVSKIIPETEGEASESDDSEVKIIDDMEIDSEVDTAQIKMQKINAPVKKAPTEASKMPRTTATTSVGVSDGTRTAPASKKVKTEPATGNTTRTASISGEVTKNRSEYSKSDLPQALQNDSRWSKKFLPAVMLWVGSLGSVWGMSEEFLRSHFQMIFDAIYPDVSYTVTTSGALFALTQQRLREWRSNIGSTAISLIVNFLADIYENEVQSFATDLLADFAFLHEDMDSIHPDQAFRSDFMLQLLGTAHLSVIAGYGDVPALKTKQLAISGMTGALALCATALERALKLIAEGSLSVREVLTALEAGKQVTLPKILNKATGKEVNTPYLFSSENWNADASDYVDSIQCKPNDFVKNTTQKARDMMKDSIFDPRTNGDLNTSATGAETRTRSKRAFLCGIIIQYELDPTAKSEESAPKAEIYTTSMEKIWKFGNPLGELCRSEGRCFISMADDRFENSQFWISQDWESAVDGKNPSALLNRTTTTSERESRARMSGLEVYWAEVEEVIMAIIPGKRKLEAVINQMGANGKDWTD
ncbi:hypothetical protein BJ138DRAFT_1105871 [Hygrophoropsis aurantiaca]|uniref:Uncharacterized protein n=1 Tax=Hygrophoropsis aurantiaca TaxID=72124 RepID=A0ACB7ZXG9_9AGAM|nr:hypothetical protein BJ138DRAFT_1105871 [Hygrophoropsis aurantiaca]